MNWDEKYQFLKVEIEPFLKSHNLNLFGIKYFQEHKENILQFMIEDENYQLSLEQCTIVNNYLSQKLDEWDLIDNKYILEVTSPGVERPLRSKAEIKESIDKYVHFTFKKDINNKNFIEGYLKEFDEQNQLKLVWNNKGQFRTMIIDYDNIKTARWAIDFKKRR